MYTEKAPLSQSRSLKKRRSALLHFSAPVPLSISLQRFVVLRDGGVPQTCITVRDTPTLEAHDKADIKLENRETLPIETIDTAGQEDFVALRDLWRREGDIVLIVFSVTELKSLRFADELVERMQNVKESPVTFVLAVKKSDLEKERRGMSCESMHRRSLTNTRRRWWKRQLRRNWG
jgi:GTPase SAR1 family protein